MRKFLFLIILSIITVICVMKFGFNKQVNSNIINKEILDISSPINVNIDLDLLRKLSPAYE